jgi:tRNA A22 N-methylase
MSEDIQRILGRIEGKLDSISENVNDNKESIKEHGIKIRGLENLKVQVVTIAGVAGTGFAFIWDIVKHKLGS